MSEWRTDKRPRGTAPRDEIIYVLTVEDVEGRFQVVYGEGVWEKLTEEQRRRVIHDATKYIESFCGGGSYTWADAIDDSFNESVTVVKPVEE